MNRYYRPHDACGILIQPRCGDITIDGFCCLLRQELPMYMSASAIKAAPGMGYWFEMGAGRQALDPR